MSVIVLFMAVIAVIAGWWLSQQGLMAKPWLEQGVIGDVPGASAIDVASGENRAWACFSPSPARLFALLISAYSMRMHGPTGGRCRCPRLLWFNTGRAGPEQCRAGMGAGGRAPGRHRRMSASACGRRSVRRSPSWSGNCWLGGSCGAAGYFVAANPANSFFYLVTAVHGLHVMGGLVALGRTTAKALARRRMAPAAPEHRVVRHLLAFPAGRLAGLARPADGLGGRFRRHLSPVADVGGGPDGRHCADNSPGESPRGRDGWRGIAADWSSDQRAFKNVSWGKAMMWIFLLSDTFIFSCFLLVLHDRADVDDRALAEPQRGLRPDDRRARISR